MAGFRKASAEQAALKLGVYGPAGSGKTFTALLIAEGLAGVTRKRIAVVDTERGSDFYVKAVPQRTVHPEAFDIDALYTRSLTEVLAAVRALKPEEYGVVIIDSITHLWEAAQNAYTGHRTKIGTIPMQAWGKIKAPYKALMETLLGSPMHVIICGRQGNEWATDEDTDELVMIGVKMKAEGETAYEPHILIRMESVRPKPGKPAIVQAFVEKDRTGVLAGKVIEWPDFKSVAAPLMGLLGGTQGTVSTEEATERDAEAIALEDSGKAERSRTLRDDFIARFQLAKTAEEVEAVGKTITPAIKRQMSTAHVADLKKAYTEKAANLRAPVQPAASTAAEEE